MPLTTTREPGSRKSSPDIVVFWMLDGTQRVRCAVTLQALEVFDPKLDRRGAAPLGCHRDQIEKTEVQSLTCAISSLTVPCW
jgi:hypothetical protein